MKSSRSGTAVILVGHGSRQPDFQGAMVMVASKLSQDASFLGVTPAYLEITSPSISEAIDFWANKNAEEIRIVPYFVLSGRHVQSDIPEIVDAAQKKYEGMLKIILCPYLGYDDTIVDLVKKRIFEAS